MVGEIRIYAEGGGDSREGKSRLRRGYGEFLRELRVLARERRIRWSIVVCGSRHSAFQSFHDALTSHPEAFNVLLVDAERPVLGAPWDHLRQETGWTDPGVPDEHCHFMVQTMEAWFVADVDALASFYGRGFLRRSIPSRKDVETIDKETLGRALERATRASRKGAYHKLRHGPELLRLIGASVVRDRARHCARLFSTLASKIGAEL